MSLTVQQTAKALEVDPATVRKWICRGCPCVRRGRRGPGNGARLDLDTVRTWRGLTPEATGLSPHGAVLTFAHILWETLDQDKADLAADISRAAAAAFCLKVWDRACRTLDVPCKFDALPDPIRALGREL